MGSSAPYSDWERVIDWVNLLEAWRKAARGKRRSSSVARFEYRLADRLLQLRDELVDGSYWPGAYTHFIIHEPKRRRISAAPFRDRVVHHSVCNVLEPRFERLFIPHSYANRIGLGTHAAIRRMQYLSRRYRFVLRLDVVKHFPSIDHEILLGVLSRQIDDSRLMDVVSRIVASGCGILDQEYEPFYFPGDDLISQMRPRGLPIGNLTSQFWSNCYLHPLDQFVTRGLRCGAYLRYVDDFALFANEKSTLWEWKSAIRERLGTLRLRFHEGPAQVTPVVQGVPWLGFVIYPDRIRVKRRKVVQASRRLGDRFEAWRRGEISFAEFDASVKGWVNHVRQADTYRLRRHVLGRFRW